MPCAGGGFEKAYNAQASVDTATHLIVGEHLTDHVNDKQEIAPALERLEALPEALGKVDKALADNGFYSAENLERCEAAGIEPFIAPGRQGHNPPLAERLADDPEPPQGPLSAVQANAHRLKTREGKAGYAQRKSTVETVFGVIKQAQGFRQFLLRGLSAVQGEWTLVCIGYNLKRLFALTA